MVTVAAVLAHQGGWDEAVLVVLPLIVLAALLRMARRRALEEEAGHDEHVVNEASPDPVRPAGAAPREPPSR